MKRIRFSLWLIFWGLGFLANGYAQTATRIAKVSLTVADLDRAVAFYEKVLFFQKVKEYTYQGSDFARLAGESLPDLEAKVALMQLGNAQLELMFFPEIPGRPIPFDSRSNDLWFQHIAIVVRDMEKAYQHLKAQKVTFVSSSPQTLPAYLPAAAGISAFYFRDPDGHNLEIIHFPPGKGNPVWQKPTEALFLGIDHTAIGISDTEVAQGFYEQIGLKKAGESENYGSEQEHLNQVFGAHLQITGLVAREGFGLEFLDYLAPPGGRPYPRDSRIVDLWHWHTTIEVNDWEALYQKLQKANPHWISPGWVMFGQQRAAMLRDPDGHALMIIEKK